MFLFKNTEDLENDIRTVQEQQVARKTVHPVIAFVGLKTNPSNFSCIFGTAKYQCGSIVAA